MGFIIIIHLCHILTRHIFFLKSPITNLTKKSIFSWKILAVFFRDVHPLILYSFLKHTTHIWRNPRDQRDVSVVKATYCLLFQRTLVVPSTHNHLYFSCRGSNIFPCHLKVTQVDIHIYKIHLKTDGGSKKEKERGEEGRGRRERKTILIVS